MSDKKIEINPLSAEYRFENKDEEIRDKFSYNAKRYDYPDDDGRGYTFIKNETFKESKDEAFANHTFLQLVENVDFSQIAVRESVDILDLILFTPLIAPNGNYLKNVDGKIFAITTPEEKLTNDNMFKIYRSKMSDHDGFVISQGTKYATVKLFMNRFTIEMKDLIQKDPFGIQHFGVYQIPGTNRISIYSKMVNPWRIQSVSNTNLTWNNLDEYNNLSFGDTKTDDLIKKTVGKDCEVMRFLSLYDGDSSNLKLEKWDPGYPRFIYESEQPFHNMLKINGNIHNNKFNEINDLTNTDTLNRVGNNYLFKVGYFDDYDRYFTIGYNGKIRWVKYFNEFFNKFFNSDVTPDKIVDDVTPSVIYECPYKTAIDGETLKINFAELKNIMTPGYSYTVKNKEQVHG